MLMNRQGVHSRIGAFPRQRLSSVSMQLLHLGIIFPWQGTSVWPLAKRDRAIGKPLKRKCLRNVSAKFNSEDC